MRSIQTVAAALLAVALVATGCGGGSDADDGAIDGELVDSGSLVLGETEVTTTTAPPAADDETVDGGATDDPSATTIPLNEENPTTALFSAAADFFECMQEFGGFRGVPNEDLGPDAAVNAPGYGEGLGTCAARTSIVDVLGAAQDATSELTPEEVETRNRGFLEFRECMIGRGWEMPVPEPDEIGLLFGSNVAGVALSWRPPDGESFEGSDDLGECDLARLGGDDEESGQ